MQTYDHKYIDDVYTIPINNDKYNIIFGIYISLDGSHCIYQKTTNIDESVFNEHEGEIINAIAQLCKKHNLKYESFHNHLFGFNRNESMKIENKINSLL